MIQRLKLSQDEARQVEDWLKLPPPPESVDPTEIPLEHRRLFIAEIEGVISADGNIAVEERENLDLLKLLVA